MEELLQEIWKNLHDKIVGVLIAAVFTFLGWYWGKRKAEAKWQRREFFDRLNVSLNMIQEGTLRIRTILEKGCAEVFLNSAATETVISLSRQTTPQDSIIPLPKEEYWFYLNAILNEVAEKFSVGQIKRDLGLPVTGEQYVLCLTNETSGEMKTRKLRAMLIQKTLLTHLPAEPPKFESPHHATRWQTLQQLAAEYSKNPWRFLEMEIVV